MEGAVRIELVEGVPIFRASILVQERIETLISKKQESALNSEEEKELDEYQELSDYLSLVNQTMKNVLLNPLHDPLHDPLHGTVIRYDDPFEPAVPPKDWEVLQ